MGAGRPCGVVAWGRAPPLGGRTCIGRRGVAGADGVGGCAGTCEGAAVTVVAKSLHGLGRRRGQARVTCAGAVATVCATCVTVCAGAVATVCATCLTVWAGALVTVCATC